MLDQLRPELLKQVFYNLERNSLSRVSQVCRATRAACQQVESPNSTVIREISRLIRERRANFLPGHSPGVLKASIYVTGARLREGGLVANARCTNIFRVFSLTEIQQFPLPVQNLVLRFRAMYTESKFRELAEAIRFLVTTSRAELVENAALADARLFGYKRKREEGEEGDDGCECSLWRRVCACCAKIEAF